MKHKTSIIRKNLTTKRTRKRLRQLAQIALLLSSLNSGVFAFFSAGVGPTYGDGIKELGINARGYYNLSHAICIGPEFALFRPEELNGATRTLWETNANMHYIFEIRPEIGAYPLIGVNYSSETTRTGFIDHSETAFGPNLGLGFHYVRGNWALLTEYKYIASHLKQSVYTFGIVYMFRGSSE